MTPPSRKTYTLHPEPHHRRRRRALRKLGLAAALASAALLGAQIVFAAPPGVTGLTITPDNTPETGESRTFTATATDPDNDIAEYQWDFDYDGTFTVDRSTAVTDPPCTPSACETSFAYSTPGARSVAVRVVDTAGDPNAGGDGTVDTSAPVVRSINVTPPPPPPNQPPTASFTITHTDQPGGAPSVVDVGEQVSFNGSASSAGEQTDTITNYAWDLDGNGSFETNTGPTPLTSRSYSTPGDLTIRLRVTDSANDVSPVAERPLSINGLPTASIMKRVEAPPPPDLPADVQVEPVQNEEAPLVGQEVLLAGGGSTDDGTLTYMWDFDLDNNSATGPAGFETPGGSASGATLGNPPDIPKFTTAGPKRVRLIVTDDDGATDEAILGFRVNSMPNPPAFITDDPTPIINQTITLSSTATDPDNDIAKYEWDFDNDGEFGEAAQTAGIVCQGPQSPTASCRFDAARTYPVKLRVTDTGGISRTVTTPLLIQNSVPNGAFEFSPSAPLPGEAVTFRSTSTATAGKQLTGYEWDFNYDGMTFTPDASGATVSHGFSNAGPKTVALRVSEAAPGGGPDTGGFDIVARTVTVNAPPQARFSVAPETAFVNDPVTLSSSSSDPDGPLTRHEWDLDNDGQFDDATGAVASARFATPGTYPLKLRVTDSQGATATAEGRVNVQNRPVPPPQLLRGVLVQLGERLFPRYTKVMLLRVRAPSGSKVTVRCHGKRCPKRRVKTSNRSKRMMPLRAVKTSKGSRKMMRFKTFERRFRPKTKLIVRVTKSGFIGTQTTYTIRRRKQARRRDLCVFPGVKKASRCPEQ